MANEFQIHKNSYNLNRNSPFICVCTEIILQFIELIEDNKHYWIEILVEIAKACAHVKIAKCVIFYKTIPNNSLKLKHFNEKTDV